MWLFDNVIGRMYGPWFLVFYFFWIVGVLWLMRRYVDRNLKATNSSSLLAGNVNPYDLACLRDVQTLTAAVLFRLLHLGFLKQDMLSPSLLVQDAYKVQHHKEALSALEQKVLDHFKLPKAWSSAQFFMQKPFEEHIRYMKNQGWIITKYKHRMMRSVAWLGLLAILGMGGYKMIAAITANHNNVLFLCIMMAVASMMYYTLIFKYGVGPKKDCGVLLTAKGWDLVKRTRSSLNTVKSDPQLLQKVVEQKNENTLLLIVILFGVSFLQHQEAQVDVPFLFLFSHAMNPYEMDAMYVQQSLSAQVVGQGSNSGCSVAGCSSGCSSGGCGSGCGGCS